NSLGKADPHHPATHLHNETGRSVRGLPSPTRHPTVGGARGARKHRPERAGSRGRLATMHPPNALIGTPGARAAFRSRSPSVVLDLDTMVAADAGVVTAGAAFAHIDLALALVRRVSPGLAEHVARLLVIGERASQSAYLVTDHLNHNDPLVLAF